MESRNLQELGNTDNPKFLDLPPVLHTTEVKSRETVPPSTTSLSFQEGPEGTSRTHKEFLTLWKYRPNLKYVSIFKPQKVPLKVS